MPGRDPGTSTDPHAFVALGDPTIEPCPVCGKKPSHYRERRGMRRLCARCYGATVRREQRAGPPLPNAIDPAALGRVTASVGRRGVCGLERAGVGPGVRLCETCSQREVMRGVAAGPKVEGWWDKWWCCREWRKKVFTLFDASPSSRGSTAGTR